MYFFIHKKQNKNRASVRRFMKMLRREQHALVRKCFVDFYKRGGALIRLQHGRTMYFPRAVILAIFADAPAATKCTLTGSACPVCYVPQRQMSEENIVGASVKRNAASNARRKSQLLNMRRVLSADKMNERAASTVLKFTVKVCTRTILGMSLAYSL